MSALVLAALLACAQTVELDVAEPFKHCMQIGYALSAYGDWDRDGHADFLISAPHCIWDSKPTVALVSGKDGRGLMVWRSGEKEGGALKWFGARLDTHADIDGDARPEIVIGTRRAGSLICSSKDGKTLYELADPVPTEVVDLDSDGFRDWLVRGDSGKRGCLEAVSAKTGKRLRTFVEDRWPHDEAVLLEAREGESEVAFLAIGAARPAVMSAIVDIVRLADGKQRVSRTIDFRGSPLGYPVAHLRLAGDQNGDGVNDLVLSMFGNDTSSGMADDGWPHGDVFVLSGRDLSTIRELTSNKKVARFGHAIDAGADINGDGVGDVLVTEYGDIFVDKTRFVVFVFSGKDGTLLGGRDGANGFGPSARFVGDADADGTSDYAVSTLYVDETTDEPGSVSLFSGKSGGLLRTWKRKFTEQR